MGVLPAKLEVIQWVPNKFPGMNSELPTVEDLPERLRSLEEQIKALTELVATLHTDLYSLRAGEE